MIPRAKKEVLSGNVCKVPSVITFSSEEYHDKIKMLFEILFDDIHTEQREDGFIKFIKDNNLENEAYRLEITDKTEIFYKDYSGIRNAVASLSNMLEADMTLKMCEIYDYPVYEHRGVMIDLARGVMDINVLIKDLIICAKAKMNYIHLHFFDSMGSAIKIESFPSAAYLPGAYTVEAVKELMVYCDALGLEVIPEFDLPAHSAKMIECFPEIACVTDNPEQTKWTACAGSEMLFEIYEAVITELSNIFNSRYFHIGGDEIEFADRPELGRLCHWDECSRCRAYMEKNNIKSRQDLWYDLLIKVYNIVKKAGKIMIMWSDQLDCSKEIPIPRDVIMQFWRIAGEGRGPHIGCSMNAQLKAGYKIINSDYPNTYVDIEAYMNSDKLKEWSPHKTPESDEEYKKNIIGTELCAWEYGNVAKYAHYAWSLPSSIVLMGDKLWNGDSLPYSEKYSCDLTRTVLGYHTPDNFNVYSCFGDIIPPRSDEKIYKDKITIDKSEVDSVLSALSEMKGNPFAEAYYKAISEGFVQNDDFEMVESIE